ncbi:MAG TPA: orotidine-5'-phosphate decarboxylase [Actinomycetota bacterium]|nr:orotidine-5'-phosphate decarboxylase [Actinomycetota bacterium]
MNPIIVALDVPTLDQASSLTHAIGDAAGAFKIGLELFAAEGPAAVRALGDRHVFLDLKLNDIPNTVAGAVRAIAPLRVELLTVHALAGRAALEAANDAKREEKVLAVTVLTSLDDAACKELGLPPVAEAVPMLAELAFAAGCDGVICAPLDVEAVRAVCPKPFLVVTPGVRPPGVAHDEQARVRTPRQAINAGADRVVIGRPITRADDPAAAARAILETLS